MSIGTRIKERREELGITQVELATRLGVSKGAVGNYETDANSPKASIMYKIFDILQCDANFLYQDEVGVQDSIVPPSDERKLITLYRKLNNEGKSKLIDYADDLVQSDKYIKIHSARMADEA